MRIGDIIESDTPSFWSVLIGRHRIQYVGQVFGAVFIICERRMTWSEWRSLLRRTIGMGGMK